MHLNYLGLVPKAQNASFFSPSCMPLRVHLWWVATVTNGLILVEPGWQATSFVYWNGSSLSRERLVSVQLLSCVRLFVTPWTAACQASLSITNSWSLPKLMSIELVMPSNHLILCHPLFLPSIFLSISVCSKESVLRIGWPKYWNFSFSVSPYNEYSELISFRMDWLDLLAVQGTLKSLLQHHNSKASILWRSGLFIVQLSHPYMTTGKSLD